MNQAPAQDEERKRGALHPTGRVKARVVSLLLVAPLVVFILLTFVLPLATVLFYAVDNPEVRQALPTTIARLASWDGLGFPDPAVYQALSVDLRADEGSNRAAEAARRLNYEIPGFRSLLLKTARSVGTIPADAGRDAILSVDGRWAEPSWWHAIRRASSRFTGHYLLAALDMRTDDSGRIVRAAPEDRLFLGTLARTMEIGFEVTVVCLLLSYPLANAIVALPARLSALMLGCVLLPFWTSLLARTTSWIVILQRNGLVNTVLTKLGITDAPLQLIFNRTGLYIALVHILLPFMILPILSVMKGIPPSYMRASASLGAGSIRSFFSVYLPLTMPGVGAGCLLTFITAAGYYITPTLIGGANDQMMSYFIAYFANTTINWGLSAALGLVLMTCILGIYVIVGRFVGIDRIVGLD